jgi:hypothetical protein
MAGDWYPLDKAFIEPTQKICSMFNGGNERRAWDLGRFSADHALKGIFRIVMRFGSPHFILSRGIQIFPGITGRPRYRGRHLLRFPSPNPSHRATR